MKSLIILLFVCLTTCKAQSGSHWTGDCNWEQLPCKDLSCSFYCQSKNATVTYTYGRAGLWNGLVHLTSGKMSSTVAIDLNELKHTPITWVGEGRETLYVHRGNFAVSRMKKVDRGYWCPILFGYSGTEENFFGYQSCLQYKTDQTGNPDQYRLEHMGHTAQKVYLSYLYYETNYKQYMEVKVTWAKN